MQIARVERRADLARVLRERDLHGPRPIVVVVGGAAGMTEAEAAALEPVMAGVAAVAARSGAVVIDGGTDVGVMRLLGRARKQQPAFPLVGVVVEALAASPGAEPAGEQARLEPNHSLVLLVPGTRWGDEAPWLARAATVLAAGAPSATVLVNGGDVAYADVEESIAAGRQVLAVAGTGRTADEIVDALLGGDTDPRPRRAAASGLVRAVGLREDTYPGLASELETILAARR